MGYQSKGHRHSEIFFSLIKRMHDTSWPVVDQRYLRTTFRRSSNIFSESSCSTRSSACSSDKIGSSSGYPAVYSTHNFTWTYVGGVGIRQSRIFLNTTRPYDCQRRQEYHLLQSLFESCAAIVLELIEAW